MYTVDSLLPEFAERIFFSVIGRFLFITNKNGSKQGLFGKDVVHIIKYLQASFLKKKVFQNLFDDICIPKENYDAVFEVIDSLQSKGFFYSSATSIQHYGLDPEIYQIITQECQKNPTPFFANIELTTACNLQCVHCYNTNDHMYLSLDVIEKRIAELKELGTLFIGLSGGEPLMHPNIKQIIDICDAHGILVQILSNATLMNEQIVNYFCQKSVQVVKVSLYSLSEDQHNQITAKNSFRQTIENILKYKDRLAFSISCPITRWNTDVIFEMKAWSKENLIPVSFSLGIVAKSDGSQNNLGSRMTIAQYKKCLTELDIPTDGVVYSPTDNRRLCSAGSSSIALDAHGDVLFCPLLKSIKLNKVNESLYDTWHFSTFLQQVRNLTRDQLSRCCNCEHQSKCHICLADNYNETGDILCVPEDVCKQRKVKFSI